MQVLPTRMYLIEIFLALAMFAPFLETFKVRLDRALSNLI